MKLFYEFDFQKNSKGETFFFREGGLCRNLLFFCRVCIQPSFLDGLPSNLNERILSRINFQKKKNPDGEPFSCEGDFANFVMSPGYSHHFVI